MREIKFRAWDKEDKTILQNWHRDYVLIEHFGFNGGGRFILMQYTGLKDKNGKEIYEGDILGCYRLTGDFAGTCEPLGAAYFDEDLLSYCVEISGGWHYIHTLEDDSVYKGYEIIGNLHENPELIK
jgi:uncharacterized phage protein (TIGR01671 family)